MKAAKEGLITYEIGLAPSQLNKLINSVKSFYLSSGDEKNDWNQARVEILGIIFVIYILFLFVIYFPRIGYQRLFNPSISLPT